MSTTADFYDGRGPSAVWLGSLQGNTDPETVRTVACGRLLMDATDPVTYGDAVIDLLDVWADEGFGHGYHPRDGWPWLWADSRDTDWVFAFVHGRVWVTSGRAWQARRDTSRGDRTGNEARWEGTMSEDNENSARSQELSTLGSVPHCPDCGVAIGKTHISYDHDGCDVARCLVTGGQRLSCEADHDCGQDVWSGWWSGDLECEQLGWMLGPDLPDLNRLYIEAVWDPERCRWVKPT